MATYYVRPSTSSHTQGDVTTYAGAWKGWTAIQWGTSANQVGPGDTLYVAGTFLKENTAVGYSGTEGSPIVICSCEEQYGASTDDPGKLWSSSRWETSEWQLYDAPSNTYYRPNTNGSISSMIEELDSNDTDASYRVVNRVTSIAEVIATLNSQWHDIAGDDSLYYRPQSGLNPTYWYQQYGPAINLNEKSWITLRGLQLSHDPVWLIRETWTTYQTGLVVDACTIRYGTYYGIRCFPNPTGLDRRCGTVTIQNCTIYDCASGMYIFGYPTELTVLNNEFYHTANIDARPPFRADAGDIDAFDMEGLGEVTTFIGNYVHDWKGGGFNFYHGSSDIDTVCYVYNNLISLDNSDPDLANNCLTLGGTNVTGLIEYFAGSIIANNILVNGGPSNISAAGAGIRTKTGPSTDPIKYYNNTFYNCDVGVLFQITSLSSEYYLSGKFRNNIFADTTTYYYEFNSSAMIPTTSLEFESNCYDGAAVWDWTDTSYSTLSTWQSGLSDDGIVYNDANSTTDDPLFTDAANGDFTLTAASIAVIDKGTNTGLATDYAGNIRPIGLGYDIGAYEYQGIESLKFPSHPVIDLVVGNWETSEGDNSYWDKVDEDDVDYNDYVFTRQSSDTIEWRLDQLPPPEVWINHGLSYAGEGSFTITLLKGTTTIAYRTHINVPKRTFQFLLTQEEVEIINNDFTDIRVRIVSGS